MNHQNELLNKIEAAKAYEARGYTNGGVYSPDMAGAPAQTAGVCGEYQKRPSMLDQAEKNTIHHSEQAEKSSRAAAFFRQNPAFDEFIQLIRQGVIQF